MISWKQTLRGQRIFNSIHHPSSKIQNRLQSNIPIRNADVLVGINPPPVTRYPPKRHRRLPKSQIEPSLNASPAIELQSNENEPKCDNTLDPFSPEASASLP
jgi:hypothetical protein